MPGFINDGSGSGHIPSGGGSVPPAGDPGGGSTPAAAVSATGVRAGSSDPTSFAVNVRRTAVDRPVNASGYQLDSDEYVEIVPIGTEAGAAPTTDVFFSTSGPVAAKNGPRVRMDKGTNFPRTVTVRNLADIWIYTATSLEGAELTVRRRGGTS